MEGQLFADFDKLVPVINVLEQLESSTTELCKGSIISSINSIKEVGSRHDDCLGSLSENEFETSIDATSSGLLVLADDVATTINVVSAFDRGESKIGTFANIVTVGLDTALKWKMSNPESKLSDLISKNEITAGYDYEFYNKLLDQVKATATNDRERSTACALFLATAFPHLPYFWGGGHNYNQQGVDSLWGTDQLVTAGGSDTTGTYIPYSMDCSGFVDWAFFNGGVTNGMENCSNCTGDYSRYGEINSITAQDIFKKANPGDLAYMDGHIGMIVDKQDGDFIIAHCSGSGKGMNLTRISSETGLVVEDSSKADRVGEEYFTDIIVMDYESD